MYTKESKKLMFQFILGKGKKRPATSVWYYQAQEKSFWAALEAWKTPSMTQNVKNVPFGAPKSYSRCKFRLVTHIIKVGQCLDCLNRRPVPYYKLDISY